MARRQQQRAVQLRISAEPLRAVDQPQVEPLLGRAHVRHQFGVKPFRIVHQIARMDFEKAGQQHARGVGQVPAAAAFDLRKIRLADALAQFFPHSADHFLLRHLALESAKPPFHFPEVAYFFAECHIAISNYYIAISNREMQAKNFCYRWSMDASPMVQIAAGWFSMGSDRHYDWER